MRRRTLGVEGMSCNGCEQNVENALRNLDGVNRVEADHEDARVEVVTEDDVSDEAVAETIEDAGYEVAG